MIQISPLVLAAREEFFSRLMYPNEAIRLPSACVKRLIGYQIMPPSIAPTNKEQPVILCDSVFKVFGENAKKMLEGVQGNVDAKAFQDAGCIVGVNNASFEVCKGEMLVVMGLSGSGKSTLLRCISKLTDATAGNIYIDGQDLLAMNNKQLIELRRNKMGMVFQSFALLPHKTVLENIAFPLQVKGGKTQDSIKKAMEMVELVGLGGRENYFPRELSGGQQQRVGIARSLAIEPDIWFLDEPFSALDPLIRKEMQDEFLRLQGVLNKTILFVTHDFDEALRLADRIAIMKDGVIEQLDTPANIVLHPATEYVHKFTEEVPREKVLKIESVMEPINSSEHIGDLQVSKDAIIETVAEAVLNESKAVSVVDANDRVVGILHPSKVISVLFGGQSQASEPAATPR
jgi:glycine betaine/proline transport system ATP-binding protein